MEKAGITLPPKKRAGPGPKRQGGFCIDFEMMDEPRQEQGQGRQGSPQSAKGRSM